jgi:hypothetical protein
MNRAIRDWDGETLQPIQGNVIAVVDCLGDWREELITCYKGEQAAKFAFTSPPFPAMSRALA